MSDRYQIVSLIEKDQLGAVYLAQDTTLQRKVIYRDFQGGKEHSKAVGFSDYTGKLCALQHPNILTIYDIAKKNETYFMVTQFLEAESLATRLEQGALGQVGVYNMAVDLLDALHTAHVSSLFHGALRTDSIKRIPRVRGGHRYLIVDFGLDRISTMVSGTHVMMADPFLMAPEIFGYVREADERSDLFTLGQLCYVALVGGHPYAGKSPEECAQSYRGGGLPHLNIYVQGVQQDFADWVMWLVSGEPEQRPASTKEAMEALHAMPEPHVSGMAQAVAEPEGYAPPKVENPIETFVEPREDRFFQTKKKPKVKKIKKEERSSRSETRNLGFLSDMSKEGRLLFSALVAVVLLLLILIFILLTRQDKEFSLGLKQDKLDIAEFVNIGKVQKMTVSSNKRVLPQIQLDRVGVIDWAVITGFPASSAKVSKKEGKCIRNILAIGNFREHSGTGKKLITYKGNGSVILPQRVGTTLSLGEAKEGEGWEVDLRVADGDEGDLVVNLFMLQKHCGFSINVRSSHQSYRGSVAKLFIPASDAGIIQIPLTLRDVQSGYYAIRILASEVKFVKDFEMGLSAITVEKK